MMISQKIERVDEIPLILHWLKIMRVAEIIDAIWHPHGNWKGLSGCTAGSTVCHLRD